MNPNTKYAFFCSKTRYKSVIEKPVLLNWFTFLKRFSKLVSIGTGSLNGVKNVNQLKNIPLKNRVFEKTGLAQTDRLALVYTVRIAI